MTFPTSIFNLPPSLFQFSFFSSQFSPFFHFFLASFFPIRQQKFPSQKSLGGTLPPCPPPVTPLIQSMAEKHTFTLPTAVHNGTNSIHKRNLPILYYINTSVFLSNITSMDPLSTFGICINLLCSLGAAASSF